MHRQTVVAASTAIVDGLDKWFSALILSEYLPAAEKWCKDEGVGSLEDVVEYVETLAEVLRLPKEKALRMMTMGMQAYSTVRKNSYYASPVDFDQENLVSCVYVSLTGDHEEVANQQWPLEQMRDLRNADHETIIPSLGAANIPFGLVGGKELCKDMSLGRTERPGLMLRRQTEHINIKRIDTVGDVMEAQPGRRASLVDAVRSAARLKTVDIDEGQTGTVYALETGGDKVAVFKPLAGEHFERRGVDVGTGALREEAAYLIDRIAGSQAGVPVTSRTKLDVHGEVTEGSVQAFVADAIGFVEDFAMPRDVNCACAFVPKQAAEALALLDMRIFNMDRHTGNLMILKPEKPHALGPIDHGCCLPPWWMLGEAVFDAWLEWPQLQEKPSDFARELARITACRLPQVMGALGELGVSHESLVTHQVCTTFIRVGVADLSLAIGPLAALMLRSNESELSWFEQRVLSSAQRAGIAISAKISDLGMPELFVEDADVGPKVDRFLEFFATDLRTELPQVGMFADTR